MRAHLVSKSLALVWLALLAGASFAVAEKSILAVRIESLPKIDGFIESVWTGADSVTEFIQIEPKEGEAATEKTVAYLLYDDQNLYVAFKCYDSDPEKLVLEVAPRGDASGDWVGLHLDTFGDKVTGYEFSVNAAGVQDDYYISADGRAWDKSWEGVWYSAAKVTDFGYVVEMRIPFKSLRYKKGLSRWGIGFMRGISRKGERVSWPPQKSEELRVSRLAQLVGIQPGEMGRHLELYPVALARYDRPETSPDAGFDFTWYPTSSSSLQFTANPDFAQVEADPHQVNLSKYETFFGERRPFFVEGMDIFRTWRGMGLMFYSRRIGKRLPGGKEVPILGGSKFIARPGRFKIGALSALTGEMEYPYGDTTRVEPQSLYSAFRVKREFMKNSELGFLYAGREGDGFGRASVLDGELRSGELSFGFVGVHTDKSEAKSGYGGKAAIEWETSKFHTTVNGSYISDHFDVSQVGFYPVEGEKYIYIRGGPILHNKGPFRRLGFSTMAVWIKEFEEPHSEYRISNDFDFNFVNNWGCYLGSEAGKRYEEELYYGYWRGDFSIWSDGSKAISGGLGVGYTSQEYNYRRGYFAANGRGHLNLQWRVNPRLRLGVGINNTTEFKPDGSTEKTSWISHPTLNWAMSRDMNLRVWSEPNTDTHIHRLNVLFSWNFKPKSWFYLALNESRDNTEGNWGIKDRIIVAKVRYLFLL